jgi:hypothetical protein
MRDAPWLFLSVLAAGCINFKDVGSDIGSAPGKVIKNDAFSTC